MFSRTSRLNKSLLFLEFSGFYILFSFQGSLLFVLNSNSFILSQLVVFVNNFFIFFLEAFRNPFRFPLNFRAALSDALYIITGSYPRQAYFSIFSIFFFPCDSFYIYCLVSSLFMSETDSSLYLLTLLLQ